LIVESILNILFKFLEWIFALLPDWNWSVEASFFSAALDFIRLAGYLLPMGTITAIFIIVNVLIAWQVLVAILRTIWDVLPLV